MAELAILEEAQTPEEVLNDLTLSLPPAREVDLAGMRRVGEMLYTPALIPRWGEEVRHAGTVDDDMTVRAAARAARLCVHNLISLVREELGSLDRVVQVLQLNVLVRCSPGFENPSRVADGASEALFQVFGSAGRHRRSVLETAELPGGAVVQASAIFRVR